MYPLAKLIIQGFRFLLNLLILTLLSIPLVFFPFAFGQSTEFSLEGSTVSFEINEVLLGKAKTVVGTSSLVSGRVTVNLDSLDDSSLTEIIVDARAFETDNRRRNASIHRRILETETYPFISFVASGLENIVKAEQLTAQLPGVLTIKAVSHDVVFDVSLSELDEKSIIGSASTVIACSSLCDSFA